MSNVPHILFTMQFQFDTWLFWIPTCLSLKKWKATPGNSCIWVLDGLVPCASHSTERPWAQPGAWTHWAEATSSCPQGSPSRDTPSRCSVWTPRLPASHSLVLVSTLDWNAPASTAAGVASVSALNTLGACLLELRLRGNIRGLWKMWTTTRMKLILTSR